MTIRFTGHALDRCAERGLSRAAVEAIVSVRGVSAEVGRNRYARFASVVVGARRGWVSIICEDKPGALLVVTAMAGLPGFRRRMRAAV